MIFRSTTAGSGPRDCAILVYHTSGARALLPNVGTSTYDDNVLGNVAVPVLFPQPLLALAVLFPIVYVEGSELRRKFTVPFERVVEANLLSTIIGIPIALVWVGLCNWVINENTGGWGTTGLISRGSLTDLDAMWVLLALVAGAMVPCFALSVLVEGSYLRIRLGIAADRPFWYSLIRAHCYSYAVLLLANCLWFAVKSS